MSNCCSTVAHPERMGMDLPCRLPHGHDGKHWFAYLPDRELEITWTDGNVRFTNRTRKRTGCGCEPIEQRA